MSHFVVIVIGGNVEAQLAPFHEYECTGIDDEYVVDIEQDVGELRREYEARDMDSYKDMPFGKWIKDWHGYQVNVAADGEVTRVWRHTNPNAKWDWWVVGGRWTGFFKGKPGVTGEVGRPGIMTERAEPGQFDALRKGDIDLEGTRAAAGLEAAERFDKIHAAIGANPWPEPWLFFVKKHGDDEAGIALARAEYGAQPGIAALQKADLYPWFGEVPGPGCRKLEIQKARDNALVPYAFVRDGKWVEKGEMGWWGMSTDKVEPSQWAAEFNKLLDELPDDTVLTAVDCHI